MKIAVLKEAEAGELRVAATPETVKKYVGLGASVAVEKGAGAGASIADADYEAAGATIAATRKDVLKDADAVLAIQGPDPKSLAGLKKDAVAKAPEAPAAEAAPAPEAAASAASEEKKGE